VNKKMVENIQNLASPNRIIWEYFGSLRGLIQEVEALKDKESIHRKVILCVFMGVAIVETFLNLYFRQLSEEPKHKIYQEQILKELDENVPLDLKVKVWPKRFFSKGIDFSCGTGQRFITLKRLRNNLMHFKNSYETIDLPGLQIQGVADISSYEMLDRNVALESLRVAEEMIAEILRLRGMPLDEIKHAMHSWTGKVPL
jgi:hypothetical protein